MSKFLLIGPSGVGKSTVLDKLSSNAFMDLYDLDDLIQKLGVVNSPSEYLRQVGFEKFFYTSKEIIENLKSNKPILIAVGAGSIHLHESHKWYREQHTIVLTGIPETIYKRGNRQKFHPTLNGYIATEFSKERKELYENAKFNIDVSNLTPDQVVTRLLAYILSF